MAKKKLSAMDAIIKWCEKFKVKYKDFQVMETSGWLAVRCANGNHYISILEFADVNRYLLEYGGELK